MSKDCERLAVLVGKHSKRGVRDIDTLIIYRIRQGLKSNLTLKADGNSDIDIQFNQMFRRDISDKFNDKISH